MCVEQALYSYERAKYLDASKSDSCAVVALVSKLVSLLPDACFSKHTDEYFELLGSLSGEDESKLLASMGVLDVPMCIMAGQFDKVSGALKDIDDAELAADTAVVAERGETKEDGASDAPQDGTTGSGGGAGGGAGAGSAGSSSSASRGTHRNIPLSKYFKLLASMVRIHGLCVCWLPLFD